MAEWSSRKFLNLEGLSHFWDKVKAYVDAHINNSGIHVTTTNKTTWNSSIKDISDGTLSTTSSGNSGSISFTKHSGSGSFTISIPKAGETSNGTVSLGTIKTLAREEQASAFHFMGTKSDLSSVLALTNAKVGDVWNISSKFTFGGQPHQAGTNIVCIKATSSSEHTEANWDALGGQTVDLSSYATKSSVNAVSGRVDTIAGYFNGSKAKNADKLDDHDSTYFATASDVTTLKSYFTGTKAKNADKLDDHDSTYFATATDVSTIKKSYVTSFSDGEVARGGDIIFTIGTSSVDGVTANGITLTPTFTLKSDGPGANDGAHVELDFALDCTAVTNADNAKSAANADKLDSHDSTYFATATDVTTLKSYFTSGKAKTALTADSATNADKLDSHDSTYFAVKSTVDSALAGKSDTGHNHDGSYVKIADFITEGEINALF